MDNAHSEKLYDQIVLCRDVWGDSLYQKVGEVLGILLKERYMCKVYSELGDDVIIIQYAYDSSEDDFSTYLDWITEGDRDLILSSEEGKN